MTDARYPERWLNDRRLLRLSDPAHRLFVLALTWSVSNRTDGLIYDDELGLIPGVDPSCADELGKAGLWERDADRWVIVEFLNTQTTAAQIIGLEQQRAIDRERKARQRARARGQPSTVTPDVTPDVTGDVTPDVTRDRTRDTEARPGQARTGQEHPTHTAARDDDPPDDVDPWPGDGEPAPSYWPSLARGYDH